MFDDLQEKFAQFDLYSGSHSGNNGGDNDKYCAIEAYNRVYHQIFTDHAPDADEAIQGFVRSWNDSMQSNADRNLYLRPLLPLLKGTKGSDRLSLRRVFMAMDWDVRVRTSAFLRLTPALVEHADVLAGLPAITNLESLNACEAQCRAADSAADSVASSAARSAARSAADSAAWSAAWSAARSAAWSAVLTPTIKQLQESAAALVKTMCALKEIDRPTDWHW